MDYRTLASLSQPGAALPGMNWQAVRRWQGMNNLQQQALQASIPQAEMDAGQQVQKNKEFMMGAPGRENLATLGNMNAAHSVENFDSAKRSKALEQAANDQKFKDMISGHMKTLGPASDAYNNAIDDTQKTKILDQFKGLEIEAPDGKKYVMGTDPERDKTLMEMIGLARKNEPKLQNKLDVEAAKGKTRLTIENMKALNSRELAELRAKHAAQLQGQRDSAAAGRQGSKPLNFNQRLAQVLDDQYGGNNQSWLEAAQHWERSKEMFGEDATRSMMDQLGIKTPGATQPRELPPAAPKAEAKSKDPVVGNVWQGAKGKGKILGIKRDASGKVIQLNVEGQGVVDFK